LLINTILPEMRLVGLLYIIGCVLVALRVDAARVTENVKNKNPVFSIGRDVSAK